MKFQTPKGTRDLLPEEATRFQKLIDLFRAIAEKYGFEPLITPAFEDFGLLAAKGGLGETVKDEIYYFKDKSERELGLRFDMTMPLARVVSSNPQLRKPFKRYAIDKVWRYDNPQAMRYREFYQADVDTIGTSSLLADAEILAVACEFLDGLGFKSYYIRLNDRKLLQTIFEKFVPKEKIVEAFRSIDKMDKIGLDGVKKELEEKGIESKNILKMIEIAGTNESVLKSVEKTFGGSEGLDELKELLKYGKIFGIENKLKVDLSLVRGLEYYTGAVFEVYLGAKFGCGGGGRYDKLIGNVGGVDLPATGISMGLNRIFETMKENKMFDSRKTEVKVFVASVNEEVKNDAIKIASDLRKEGISCQVDLMNRSLGKQFEYADSMGIPFVLVVGPEEVKKKKYKLKDMKKKSEKETSLENILNLLR
jgi:histidyl-tRNA synthetase